MINYAFLCSLDVPLRSWLKTEKCNNKKTFGEINIIFTAMSTPRGRQVHNYQMEIFTDINFHLNFISRKMLGRQDWAETF